jgi:hypothetical protein
MEATLLTIYQASQTTGISEAALRHRVARGQIRARKIGVAVMIEKAEVERLREAPRSGHM